LITSKRGYYATDLFSYTIVDRYNKKIGKISDLIISRINFRINYLIIEKKKSILYLIPSSLVTSEEKDKTLRVNQMKERLTFNEIKTNPIDNLDYFLFSDIKKFSVFDIMGKNLGNVANITFHTGLNVNLLVGNAKDAFNPFQIDFSVIPYEQIIFVSKDSDQEGKIIINLSNDTIDEINITAFEDLFTSDRIKTEKKRYIIVENSLHDILIQLNQIESKISSIESNFQIKIFPIDSNNRNNVAEFVELFNFILLNSPDTYIPINKDLAIKYFSEGTFIASQYNKFIGYTTLTIQKESEKRIGVISGIGIHPNHRGKKISLLLFKKAMDYFSSQEIDLIQADIFDSNTPSLNLFSSFGFKQIDEIFLD
jgi:ribosomal 30S subunit maturation factor RimM/ribosomal protein S18 acetylase RimI-like enzyme